MWEVLSSDPSALVLAGALLLFFGWALLPSRPELERDATGTVRHPVARVLAGASLALLAFDLSLFLEKLTVAPALGSVGGAPTVVVAPLPLLGSLLSILIAFTGPLFPAGDFSVVPAAIGAVAGAISTSGRWRASGVMAWLGLALLSTGFIFYGLRVLVQSSSALPWGFAFLVLASETGGLTLLLCYQFYALEFLTGRRRRRHLVAPLGPSSSLPHVAVQIACFNEPGGLVEGSLRSVLALDYPREKLHVQVLDDSSDPTLQSEVRSLCQRLGVELLHRDARRGYKAGALNDGLHVLPSDVAFLAIVDADYEVDPKFLRRTLGFFADPRVAFVQTPQAYRNAGEGPLSRAYALADAYFYRVVQPVRDGASSAIFCGTMGVLRRKALEDVGGWNERSITEDAELSLRLYARGWSSVYHPELLGRGLAPLTMEDLRSQHARWAFGGLQMLRLNRAAFSRGALTTRQRADFRLGGTFWLDGIFLLGMAVSLALIVAGGLVGITLPTPSYSALAWVASAPVLLLADSVLKIRLALRESHRTTIWDAVGILGFWYAIKLNDLRAALRGWAGSRMAFRRTPKLASGPSGGPAARIARAVRSTRLETSLALSFGAIAVFSVAERWLRGPMDGMLSVPAALLLGWLLFYAVAFASAPRLAAGALHALARGEGPSLTSHGLPAARTARPGAPRPTQRPL